MSGVGSDPGIFDLEAYLAFRNGDLAGCISRVLPRLPRTCEENILLLFAALVEQDDDEILSVLRVTMAERLIALDERASRGFLAKAAAVLGLDLLSNAESSHEATDAPDFRLWLSLLRFDGGSDAIEALEARAELPIRSLEGLLARIALDCPNRSPAPLMNRADRLKLRVRLFDRLGLDEQLLLAANLLLDDAVDAGDDDAAAEALVTAAESFAARGMWREALDYVVRSAVYLTQASGGWFVRAALMIDGAPESVRDAAFTAAEKLGESFAARSIGPETDLVVEQIAVRMRSYTGRAVRDGVLHVVLCDRVQEVGIRTLSAACMATIDDGGPDDALVAVASEVIRRGPQVGPWLPALASLVRTSGHPELALALTDMAETDFMALDDDQRTSLVITRSAAYLELDRLRDANSVLADHLRTNAPSDPPSENQVALLTVAVRVAFHTHCLEEALSPLYELRRILADPGAGTDKLRIEVAMKLGALHNFTGAKGNAQRFFWEPSLCDGLPIEPAEGGGVKIGSTGLQLVRASLDSATDDEFAERLDDALMRDGDSHREDRQRSDLESYVTEHVRAHVRGDTDAVITAIKAALNALEQSCRGDGLLAQSMRQRLGLAYAAIGDLDSAIDWWLAGIRQATEYVLALGVAAPLEDLREPCALLAANVELAVRIAAASGEIYEQQQEELAILLLSRRTFWADIRVARRRLGADAACLMGPQIAAIRHKLTRLIFDGPSREETIEFAQRVWTLRRERDQLEIAGVRGIDIAALRGALDDTWIESVARLDSEDGAFVAFIRLANPTFSSTLVGRLAQDAEEYFGVVRAAQSWRILPVGSVESIEAIANQLLSDIRADALDPRGSSNRILQPMRDAMLPTFSAVLSRAAGPIYVLGEGVLSEIPWKLILEQDEQRVDIRGVSTFRSIGVERPPSIRLTERALVVGHPSYGPPSATDPRPGGIRAIADLPSTGVEAEIVATYCGAAPLKGADATVDEILSRAPTGVLHIATHAFFLRGEGRDDANEQFADYTGAEVWVAREDLIPGPLNGTTVKDPFNRAGIALAGINGWLGDNGRQAADLGFITASEVAGMNLSDVDCVVLSACSSALGRGDRGSSGRGMRLALAVAGARWAIASLWPVPDVATVLLMSELYAGFSRGLDPPAALAAAQDVVRGSSCAEVASHEAVRQLGKDPLCAQAHRYIEALGALEMHQPFAHPYFWSGFVVSA